MFHQLRRRLTDNGNYVVVYTVKRFCSLAFHFFMKIMGPALVCLANAIILAILYMYFVYLLPAVVGDSTPKFIMHSALAIFFAFNVLFNYVNCVRTDPGSPAPVQNLAIYFADVESGEGARLNPARLVREVAPHVKYRYCAKCKCIKPPRAHHDSITGKCVFHMDHYCPWMANCVGYYNYRYFVLFLLYVFLGCVYAVILTAKPFLAMPKESRRITMEPSHQSAVTFVFMITLSVAISVGILLCWHVYLTLTNQTTIEYYINFDEASEAKLRGELYRNPYDKGWRKNLQRVFGDRPLWLAVLPSLAAPPPPQYPWLPPPLSEAQSEADVETAPLLDVHGRHRARTPGSRRKDHGIQVV